MNHRPTLKARLLKKSTLLISVISFGVIYSTIKTLYPPSNAAHNSALKETPAIRSSYVASIPKLQKIWQTFTIHKGETLSTLFKRHHFSQAYLYQLLNNQKAKTLLTHLRPNSQIKIRLNAQGLQTLRLVKDDTHYVDFIRKDDKFTIQTTQLETQIHQVFASTKIERSFFEAGQKAHIPSKVLYQLMNLFSSQVNFSRNIRKGDSFKIIYEQQSINNKILNPGKIIAAELDNQGHHYYAIGFKVKGQWQYFDKQGHNLKKAFARFPVKFSHVSSTFNYHRDHPILGITRPHKGIDLAANHGTPIRAVSDGTVKKLLHTAGYGKHIVIQHNNKYETLYAHMHRFKPNLKRYSRVKRGEVIGYVGQTGLATGPHCHFEFHIHGNPVNPATVKLPMAESIPKSLLSAFNQQKGSMLSRLEPENKANA